ncbi:uncharacterized protein LOC118765305 [Octopus sinensis]|uniref:Uncharacterized protein LOC118765305 n=1 Tax=Octopus sinensis TaxID=2607531 RepID=A0A7E6F7I6_9MOLL|nr:uncharacterized protein LOC118765305 [Octopus sinensis]
MFFWNVFRGKILLLSCMVFHSLALDANDKLCTNKQLILLPKEIYKNCNVFVSQRDALDAPTVKVPANANLKEERYIMVILGPDEWKEANISSPHWLRTHISRAELKSGITSSLKDACTMLVRLLWVVLEIIRKWVLPEGFTADT